MFKSPRNIHLILLLLIFFLSSLDHLTSPVTKSLASPADETSACAPCGAPCPE